MNKEVISYDALAQVAIEKGLEKFYEEIDFSTIQPKLFEEEINRIKNDPSYTKVEVEQIIHFKALYDSYNQMLFMAQNKEEEYELEEEIDRFGSFLSPYGLPINIEVFKKELERRVKEMGKSPITK